MKITIRPPSRVANAETSLERSLNLHKQVLQPLRSQRKSVPCLPTQMISAVHCPSLNEIQKQRDSNIILQVFLERQRNSSSGSFREGISSERVPSTVERLSSNIKKQTRGRKQRGSMHCVELWSSSHLKKFLKPENYTITNEQNRNIVREATRSTESYRKDLETYFRKRNPEFDRERELVKHLVGEPGFLAPMNEKPKIVFDFQAKDVVALDDQKSEREPIRRQSKLVSISTASLENLKKLEEYENEPPSIERHMPASVYNASSLPLLEEKTPSTPTTSAAILSRPRSTIAMSLLKAPQASSEIFYENQTNREPRRRYSVTSLDEEMRNQQDPTNLKNFNEEQIGEAIEPPLKTSRTIKSMNHLSRCLEMNKIKLSNSKIFSSNNINHLIKSIEMEQTLTKQKVMPEVMFVQPCLREKMLKNRFQEATNFRIKSSVLDTFYQKRPSTSRKLWHL